MATYRTFIRTYFVAVLLFIVGVVGFVTWVDPFRNLGFSWALPFVSDRNIGYRKFKMLEDGSKGVTTLVVGSSTSEAFVPEVLRQRYGGSVFSASVGGAGLPLRSILIQQALRKQRSLKKIIYVADLFEFAGVELSTSTYYQPEMVSLLGEEFISDTRPNWSERFNDFSSYLVIDRSIRTLKDYRAFKNGTYASSYHSDGSTTQSMIGGRPGGTIEERARASAVGMESVYKKMERLSPVSHELFRSIVAKVNAAPGVELHVILSPFHPAFIEHFKAYFDETGVYASWVAELRSHASSASSRIHIHDFSYPEYLQRGLSGDERYWQDGVHLTSEAMLIMVGGVYK